MQDEIRHESVDSGAIQVNHVAMRFQPRNSARLIDALQDVNLSIKPGEFVSLVGPSGCGKSTLLKIIAGLITPTSGQVYIDNEQVNGPRRSVGIMFQTPELFPWRSVVQNVMLPIQVFRYKNTDVYLKRAHEILRMVGLEGFENVRPRDLSGGMQQRVALARTLIADPNTLLMDEPFGALDEMTRERLNLELLRIWEEHHKTVVFVTHNIGEAVFLSDRVVVMGTRPGRILEVIDISLPRPRSIASLKDPMFTECEFAIRELLGVSR